VSVLLGLKAKNPALAGACQGRSESERGERAVTKIMLD